MRVFLIGGEGFVGSAYARLLARTGIEHAIITRANYDHLVGQHCDVLINANGNSKKFMADRDPKWEFAASVSSVVASLHDFKADRYVFLSSGDVYPSQENPAVTAEDQVIDRRSVSRYGLHKLTAEDMVRAVHPRPLVMRMGGFVGPGLKKNAIYDMIHGPTLWLHPDSELQFISTDRAAEIVWGLVQRGAVDETINLGARGVVRIGDVHRRLGSKVPFHDGARRVRFELDLTKLAALAGDLPESGPEVDGYLRAIGSRPSGG